jgi:RNA polymerase sigma factor (sigma-70 family)
MNTYDVPHLFRRNGPTASRFGHPAVTAPAPQVDDGPVVQGSDLRALVQASIDGDESAWNELVRRYADLVMAICRQYRLRPADAQDVSQTVWLRLVEHLGDIREPAALSRWIATTTKHECLRQIRAGSQVLPLDPLNDRQLDSPDSQDVAAAMMAAERHQVLLDGLAELPDNHRNLLTLLLADPPHSYTEISKMLNIPIGSIGPTRARVLERLRSTTPIRTYMEATREAAQTGGGRRGLTDME